MVSLPAALSTSQVISLPEIPELFQENFLDILVPSVQNDSDFDMLPDRSDSATVAAVPRNAMMDALSTIANQTRTANLAPALASTLSAPLDAFMSITQYEDGDSMANHLDKSWEEDPQLTLRIIWCLRSIPDGKGNKETFYRAFGWLFDKHPRTAITNLHLLVEPVSYKRKTRSDVAHGYWKDLLNILAMATVGELSPHTVESTFLHAPRTPYTYSRWKRAGGRTNEETPADRIAASVARTALQKEAAKVQRVQKHTSAYETLSTKLADPKFRALYIAVARLFAVQLAKDVSVLNKIAALPENKRYGPLSRTISLAGKWAPTPSGSHDRVTNISSAIALLLSRSELSGSFPSSLKGPLETRDKFLILRSFFQRWVLRPLREVIQCPEPLMAANRWKEIRYTRVPSICMKKCTELFYMHDPEGFEKYLVLVESGKKTISGATLMPHEIVAKVVSSCYTDFGGKKKLPALQAMKKKLAETGLRVAEAQWKTLISNLRASGSIENSIAICDVSGSMGRLHPQYDVKVKHIEPILPAVSLSLVLASLAKAPFNGGFITFSEHPQYVQLDLDNKSLYDTIQTMGHSAWGMSTDLNAVFLKLLLPLAQKHNIKQEDMIKRLFIFSDMQFNEADGQRAGSAADWETNYDLIEKAYKAAGYEVPQIVYWDLSVSSQRTVEVLGDRKGVAMMNGFSAALLKVFMGEEEEAEAWEKVDEEGNTVVEEEEDEFTPINVMKKALMRKSFDGLVVVD